MMLLTMVHSKIFLIFAIVHCANLENEPFNFKIAPLVKSEYKVPLDRALVQSDLLKMPGENFGVYPQSRDPDVDIAPMHEQQSNEKPDNNHHFIADTIISQVNASTKDSDSDVKSTGKILDEFTSGKLGVTDAGNTLPIFLSEPENSYVVKNRPAILKCKAAHALQLHFKCSGSSQPPPSTHDKHVDPHTGTHVEEVTATISRDLVDEYFGKGSFKCECHAWSSRGVVKSQAASINIAYIRKQFAVSPTSLRVEIGTNAELKCEPPNGFPEPKITWLKNNVPITESPDVLISYTPKATLVLRALSLQDMANYTCAAENIAGKRISESAVLIVYVNGGWSPWGPWKECKCAGKTIQGRKRMRSCTNPMPLNGGSQCSGPLFQKSSDCVTCLEDTQIITYDAFDPSAKRNGRWTSWSEWSICSFECIQIRRRRCISQFGDEATSSVDPMSVLAGKLQCIGKDIQTAECRGEQCPIGKDEFDWTLYLGLAFILTIFLAFGTTLIFCAKRGIRRNPHYNMTNTVMETEYIHGVEKKEIRMHVEAVNAGYDYINPSHAFMPSEHVGNCSLTEHHYDVPNLSVNYTNPIDDLSMDYISDSAESSAGDSTNSTFDLRLKLPMTSSSLNTVSEIVNNSGRILSIYNNKIMLYIPEMTIGKSSKRYFSLMLLSDDSPRIPSINSDTAFICSTIVQCGPRNFNFLKPVILSIPHCLCEPESWNVSIFHADNDYDDLNVNWRKVVTVGEETINTPMYVQLESTDIYLMTEQLGRFLVVGSPKNITNSFASVKMKLFAFSQFTPSHCNGSLRVYVVKDFPNSKDICTSIESKLGGSYMGESQTFAFQLNNCNLNIRVRYTSEEQKEVQSISFYEQLIPYNHILNSNTILHCEFSMKPNETLNFPKQSYYIEFSQVDDNITSNYSLHSFSIPNNGYVNVEPSIDQLTTISIDKQGNCINETTKSCVVKLPPATKRLLMSALDPPRSDEKDWRLLAKKLNTDRYIAYFATKPSPTEQLLNLWECRAIKSKSTMVELLLTLREIERQDVMDIIVETIGPLWI